jgi:hypothetical protein
MLVCHQWKKEVQEFNLHPVFGTQIDLFHLRHIPTPSVHLVSRPTSVFLIECTHKLPRKKVYIGPKSRYIFFTFGLSFDPVTNGVSQDILTFHDLKEDNS